MPFEARCLLSWCTHMKQSRPVLDRDRQIPGGDFDARRAAKTLCERFGPGSHVPFIGLRVAKKYPYEKDLLPRRLDIAMDRRLIERLVLGRFRIAPEATSAMRAGCRGRVASSLSCHSIPPLPLITLGGVRASEDVFTSPKEQEDVIALLAEANQIRPRQTGPLAYGGHVRDSRASRSHASRRRQEHTLPGPLRQPTIFPQELLQGDSPRTRWIIPVVAIPRSSAANWPWASSSSTRAFTAACYIGLEAVLTHDSVAVPLRGSPSTPSSVTPVQVRRPCLCVSVQVGARIRIDGQHLGGCACGRRMQCSSAGTRPAYVANIRDT